MMKDIFGGLVIIAVASGVGLAQNTVRSRPVKLIQTVQPVSTSSHEEAPKATDVAGGAALTDTAAHAGPADAPLPEGAVSVEQVKAMLESGGVVLLDARSPSAFADGHIPGAVNIPYDQLPNYLETLELTAAPNDRIICYCWSPTCDFSDQLATELKIMGYEDVLVFTGGWNHWTEAGYETEKGASE